MSDYFQPTEGLADDGNFVFDATGGGGRSAVLLPYIEQHGETGDGGSSSTGQPETGRGRGYGRRNSNHHPR